MAELRRSLAYSAAESYLGFALQLVGTVVLSRVLTPAEVGVFAVATVFAALASNFRDFGIAEYLIQAPKLTEENIRAAFAVNIIMSWAMGLAIFFGAGPIGAFYKSASITEVLHVYAFNFLLIPFGAINMAWFRRELNFKPQFVSGVVCGLVSLGLSVGLALQGFGALSLAWASLGNVLFTVLVSMYYRPKDFPRRPSLRGIGEVMRFGSVASGIYVLGQLGKGAPEMIIGRVQGVTDVALFSRASGLVQLFRQLVVKGVMPVCLPYFSKAVREEQNVRRAYVRGVAIFTAIGWTFLGFLAMAAYSVIRIVYGNQWATSVPLAPILCVAGAVELVHYLAKEALLSHGRVALATRLQFTLQVAQVLGLAAVLPFGLIGACWGMLAAAVAGLALSQWHMAIGTQFRVQDLWDACRTSLWVTALALAPMGLLFASVTATEANYIRFLIAGGSLTTVAWLLALRATGHPLWSEVQRAIAMARGLLRTAPRAPGG